MDSIEKATYRKERTEIYRKVNVRSYHLRRLIRQVTRMLNAVGRGLKNERNRANGSLGYLLEVYERY